ncbi:hypothetical protein ACIBQ6_21790 [Nonomuraea sp. NPDC049655]|uniref:hypothetical protein n=1 Tax=Nonomuraea sp. NPDC049655 TaxID=3364355 RepID=UPI0037929909
MTTETIRIVEATPSAFEVAILHLADHATARVHHPFGVKEYTPLLVEDDVYVVVPGWADVIGWGAVCWHYTLRGVRNGRHRLDRDAWHAAAELLHTNPVVYVTFERRDYYGTPRWTAVHADVESLRGLAARLAEQAVTA